MRYLLVILFSLCVDLSWSQENYVLESRYRNPIDTSVFANKPTMMLFVHPKCKNGNMCPTARMQKALENDTLGFRSQFGIRLLVVYPKYSENDIKDFDSFEPRDAKVCFYTYSKYRGAWGEEETTPFIIFYDGKGHIRSKTGGSIEELKDSVCNVWRYFYKKCPVCHGKGSVTPDRLSHDPDLVVGICRRCSDGIIGREQLY